MFGNWISLFSKIQEVVAPVFAVIMTNLTNAFGNETSNTNIRNSTATAFDYLGVLKTIPINSHRLNYGRSVENLIKFSEDMTNPVWSKVRNCTVSSPDTITFTPTTSSGWSQYDTIYQSFLAGYQVDVNGKVRFDIKGIPGETVSIGTGVDGGIWQPNTNINIILTNHYVTYELDIVLGSLVSPAWGPNFTINRFVNHSVTTMNIRNVQVSYTAGHLANYIPEYVPRLTSAPAIKWFDDTGGQSSNDALDLSNDGGMLITGNSIKKVSGGTGWNAAVSSNNNFTGSAYLEATVAMTNNDLMIGLNDDPKTNTSFGSINHAIFIQGSSFKVYESGAQQGGIFATVKQGDKISILYEGTTIHYQLNGTDFHTTTVAAGLTLAIDTSFDKVGDQLDNIIFNAKKINEPLHPSHIFEGANRYRSFMPYATAQVVAAGGHRFEGGRHYQTILGGTTNGTTLTTDIGVTDWIDKGIYNAEFGVLVECGSTNFFPNSEIYTSIATNSVVIPAPTNNNAIAPDGTNTYWTYADGCTGFNQHNYTVLADTSQWTFSRDYKGTSGSVNFISTGINGSDTLAEAILDIATGVVTGVDAARVNVSPLKSGGYRISITTTNNGTGTLFLPRETMVATNPFVGVSGGRVQLENSPIESTYIKTSGVVATRANEMGNIKWNSSFFPQAAGTLGLTIKPQYNSGDLVSIQRLIVGLVGASSGLLYHSGGGTTNFSSTDNISVLTNTISSWSHTDALEFFVRWGIGADSANPTQSRITIMIRNANKGESFVSVSSPYDGNFPSAGFYQWLKSGDLNNTIFLNNTIWDKTLADTEINALVEI